MKAGCWAHFCCLFEMSFELILIIMIIKWLVLLQFGQYDGCPSKRDENSVDFNG